MFFYIFVLLCFVVEIFRFECFVLPTNYVTPCIMSHQKSDYKVVFLLRDDLKINGTLLSVLNLSIMSFFQEFYSLGTQITCI